MALNNEITYFALKLADTIYKVDFFRGQDTKDTRRNRECGIGSS